MITEIDASKNTIAEIGLGDRAKAGNCAALCHIAYFARIHMGGVDQAPAPINWRMIKQPAHGALAGPRKAILHLARLFGDMDMDRPFGAGSDEGL